jgi:hypothetical protein
MGTCASTPTAHRTGTSHTRAAFPQFEAPADFAAYASGEGAEKKAPAPAQAKQPDRDNGAPRSHEAVVDGIVTCLGTQPQLREVLYKLLAWCVEPRDMADAEAFVAAQDEYVYSHVIQAPYAVVGILEDAGGLVRCDLDADGRPVDDAVRARLGDDAADDLVCSTVVSTTDEGAAVVELLSPARRIEAQLAQKPHRRPTYLALLRFCAQPRSLKDIQDFFASTPDLALDLVTAHQRLAPDYYVDRLEKAGGLVWRGAWVATEAGLRAAAQAGDPCTP